ncbi:MAG TPA: putative Ig domain-containing protein [Candidatus Dormibacteraeota bacterium]|nr:putative Ig domain-containing protein [Candidatus Dormibacteraeota bacterium]
MRSEVVKGRGYGAVAVAALLLLLYGCVRPQGVQSIPTPLPSPTPAAQRPPLTISNPVLHSGEVGVTYAPVTLSATGGLAPYTWSVSVGALPGGLVLSPDGVISGTPTQNGFFAFSVQVFDTGSQDTAGVPANIPIVPRLTASLVSGCATECTVELGCVSVCGAFGQVSGGAAPLTYTRTSGPLPAGTTLNGLTLNGTFIGLPGRLQFTVQVTDGFGVIATIAPRYNLLPHISFGGGALSCPYNGCGAPSTLPYQGGSGTPGVQVTSWVVTCDYPPCGPQPTPAVSAAGGSVAITVPPSHGGNGYKAVLQLLLTDKSLCGAGTYCSAAGTVNVVVLPG